VEHRWKVCSTQWWSENDEGEEEEGDGPGAYFISRFLTEMMGCPEVEEGQKAGGRFDSMT